MRTFFFLLGSLLSGGGLYLGWRAAFLVERLKARRAFSLEVWQDDFWFAEPSEPFAGLGPNAKWFLMALAAFLLLWIGWNLLATSRRMRE